MVLEHKVIIGFLELQQCHDSIVSKMKHYHNTHQPFLVFLFECERLGNYTYKQFYLIDRPQMISALIIH